MTTLALSIGSNIDAESNIRAAIAALRVEFEDIRVSTTYESQSVGFDGDNFLNLVLLAETDKPLGDVAVTLKRLEDQLGRDRQQTRFSGRTMDIDILLYGEEAGMCCGIELPRPEVTENAYVLQPLAELLPDWVNPATEMSYRELWQDYDKSKQRLWPIEVDWSGE
ncbi:MAG: 2-amino-4-hydroxy-6-hydroxymethyldihydropteridine diphosphokinase [Pseudohongiella sp.]|nr:MAG: 2-amino-4-hydroxy-6-hydroxymethyldihydropteridine diphosphokinase [Pseudohongiella sp.]